MVIKLKDNYKICPPLQIDTAMFLGLDDITSAPINVPSWTTATSNYENIVRTQRRLEVERLAKAFIHATRGTIIMRMLLAYKDGEEHHFDEMAELAHIKPGNDYDCWKYLRYNKLIAFSSKHVRGKQYYKITELGKIVVNCIETNDIVHRVFRWFKTKDQDYVYQNMMMADLNDVDNAFEDVSAENCLAMVKALLDTSSSIYKIGSVCKWMNTFMYLLKASEPFYEHINIPEINEWLDNNIDLSYATREFYPKWKRIQKKWLKKLGKKLTKPRFFDII